MMRKVNDGFPYHMYVNVILSYNFSLKLLTALYFQEQGTLDYPPLEMNWQRRTIDVARQLRKNYNKLAYQN